MGKLGCFMSDINLDIPTTWRWALGDLHQGKTQSENIGHNFKSNNQTEQSLTSQNCPILKKKSHFIENSAAIYWDLGQLVCITTAIRAKQTEIKLQVKFWSIVRGTHYFMFEEDWRKCTRMDPGTGKEEHKRWSMWNTYSGIKEKYFDDSAFSAREIFIFTFFFFYFLLFTTVLSQWDFSQGKFGEFGLPFPKKASCDRFVLPNLRSTLGVVVFPQSTEPWHGLRDF